MEKIDSIRIFQVSGMPGAASGTSSAEAGTPAAATFPEQVMNSALQYQLAKPIVDAVMKDAGLSNEGMVTVAILYLVGAGVTETGAIDFLAGKVLGTLKSPTIAVTRLMLPTAAISAFINNTPLVAMLIPIAAAGDRTSTLRSIR